MKVRTLIELLSQFDGELEVSLEAGFELGKPMKIRRVIEHDGTLILRDYYMSESGDVVLNLLNGQQYERV